MFCTVGLTQAAIVITDFETDIIGSPHSGPITSIVGNVTVETTARFSGAKNLWSQWGNFAYFTTGPGVT